MKKYFAEMIGTMVLVLMGCGSAVLAGPGTLGIFGIGLLGISLAFGLSVSVMAQRHKLNKSKRILPSHQR